MRVSIIIPCYNEENTIEEILRRINEINLEKEIIVVDDGSTDGTYQKLENIKNKFQFNLFCHKTNLGKGEAIKTALNFVSGDYVIIQDADLEYDPKDYHHLLEAVQKNNAVVVYGSRRLNPQNKKGNLFYYLGGIFLTRVTNMLYGTKITDVSTCYKLFKTEIIRDIFLESKKFDFCTEVTAKISKKGIKIHEVPIHYYPRSPQEGKKLKWYDGFILLWSLIKNRF